VIGIGLAFIVVGIVLYLAGIGRRAHRGGHPTQPGP
jgi:hypothetical protein